MTRAETLAAISKEMTNHTELSGHDKAVLRNKIFTVLKAEFSNRQHGVNDYSWDKEEISVVVVYHFFGA